MKPATKLARRSAETQRMTRRLGQVQGEMGWRSSESLYPEFSNSSAKKEGKDKWYLMARKKVLDAKVADYDFHIFVSVLCWRSLPFK